VAPDLLGFGGTDKPSYPDAYTLKRQAAEVVGLLDCATGGGGKAVAVGHDMYGSFWLSGLGLNDSLRWRSICIAEHLYSLA